MQHEKAVALTLEALKKAFFALKKSVVFLT